MATAKSLSSPISYHRLMKSPLDDSEIFTTITDLMNYCSSGAWYEGQKVSVTLANGVQFHYQIRNGIPILIPTKTWEPVWKTFSSVAAGTHGMLIYHWNDPNAAKYVTDTNRSTFIEDPNCFSLFDTVGIFKYSGKFYFRTEITTRSSKATTTYSHNQSYDPIEEASSLSVTQTASLKNPTTLIKDETGIIKTASSLINLCPVTADSTYIIRVYAINDTYYEAWGGGGIS